MCSAYKKYSSLNDAIIAKSSSAKRIYKLGAVANPGGNASKSVKCEWFFTSKKDMSEFIFTHIGQFSNLNIGICNIDGNYSCPDKFIKSVISGKKTSDHMFKNIDEFSNMFHLKRNVKFSEYIEFCKSRNLGCKKSDVQVHHICPRFMGGMNTKDNYTFLTETDHMVAHILLKDALESMAKNAKSKLKRQFYLTLKNRNPPFKWRHVIERHYGGNSLMLTYDSSTLQIN